MLTKKYNNGFVTIKAELFPPCRQETIDSEIRNSEVFREAIQRLHYYEVTEAIQRQRYYGVTEERA